MSVLLYTYSFLPPPPGEQRPSFFSVSKLAVFFIGRNENLTNTLPEYHFLHMNVKCLGGTTTDALLFKVCRVCLHLMCKDGSSSIVLTVIFYQFSLPLLISLGCYGLISFLHKPNFILKELEKVVIWFVLPRVSFY